MVLVDGAGTRLVADRCYPHPRPRRCRFPGRRPLDHRQVLRGSLFGWKSGIPWDVLPQARGCGSGITGERGDTSAPHRLLRP